MKKILGVCAALGLLAAAGSTECMLPLNEKKEWTYKGDRNAKKVTVPKGKLRMCADACRDMLNLEEVILPGGFQSIRARVFYGCVRLSKINLPGSVKFIGESAFENCTGLREITLSPNIEKIRKGAFNGCTSLKSIIIPSYVTKIDEETFKNCTGLCKIILSPNIEKIKKGAFYGCTSLESMTIPPQVTVIAEETFKNCTRLREIKFYPNVKKIGEGAFYGCTSLGSIIIPPQVTVIAEETFRDCTGLREIILSKNTKIIGREAFKGCRNLSKIISNTPTNIIGNNIPTGTEITICNGAFSGCESLIKFAIPGRIRRIEELAFEDCTHLTRLEYNPVSDESSIAGDAFKGCPLLLLWMYSGDKNANKVEVPGDVRWIGKQSFMNMPNLEEVYLPNSLEVIDENAFKNCQRLVFIFIPNSVKEIEKSAFEDCINLMFVQFGGRRLAFDDCIDLFVKLLFEDQSSEAVAQLGDQSSETVLRLGDRVFANCWNLIYFFILGRVSSFGDECFSDCMSLMKFYLPNSVTNIGKLCFSGCDCLRELCLPNSVTNIGYGCFWGCRFYSIFFESGGKAPLILEEDAFGNCETETKFKLPPRFDRMPIFTTSTRLTHINVPSSVEIIPEGSFDGCPSLLSISFDGATESSTTPLEILSGAFRRLPEIVNIFFPARLRNIAAESIVECPELTRIMVGVSTNIQAYAFKSCSKLSEVHITLGDGVTKGHIEGVAFDGQSKKVYVNLCLLEMESVSEIPAEEMNSYVGKYTSIDEKAFPHGSTLWSSNYSSTCF